MTVHIFLDLGLDDLDSRSIIGRMLKETVNHYTKVLGASTVVGIRHELDLMRDASEALITLIDDYIGENDLYELSDLENRIQLAKSVYRDAKGRLDALAVRFGYTL
jgi:hypothetical protein